MIDFIEHYLDGLPEWFNGRHNNNKLYVKHQQELWRLPFTYFHTEPCISFKTGNGIRRGTQITKEGTDELPIWGNITNLKEQYETK